MSVTNRKALRDAFGQFMTGVTVVTTRTDAGIPLGFTANSFTSVSLDPALLLVCPGKFLSSYDAFLTCKTFAISILAEGQESVSNTFAGSAGDRFASVITRDDCHSNPLVDGAVATFSCQTHQVLEAGDHAILIGEVIAHSASDRAGLGYRRGQYFSLGLERIARRPDARKNLCGAIIRSKGCVLLEQTPNGYRPPSLDLPDRSALRQSLADFLARNGIDAQIGPVYSVFDDMTDDSHYAYLLASAKDIAPGLGLTLQAIEIASLPKLAFTSPAIAEMMRRYAQETRAGNFTLYLGDTERGDTHIISDKG